MMSDKKIYFVALAVVVVLFFGSCIYGYTAFIEMPEATTDEIVVTFQSSTTELDTSAPALLSWQIFFNNLKVCLILFIGGMTFGAVTLFVLVSNGYVIGSISGVMLRGYDVSVFAATIVPHGIFEIAAILMAAALGLQTGRSLYLDAQGRDNAGTTCLWYGTRFLLVVVPLLIIAALVETFVTPEIAMMVLSDA
ncbi:MAG: stage II sporulation protein M [Methanocalculaceae archaeon]|jgi:stage II sporulation protein M|nr:stage II sporulation protein M [Methanocalculaceae archaeon]